MSPLTQISVYLAAVVLDLFLLREAIRARSVIAKLACCFLALALLLLPMWFFATYGKSPDETVACMIFSGKGCAIDGIDVPKKGQADAAQRVEPKISAIDRFTPILSEFGEWWQVGTPTPPMDIMKSDELLWNYTLAHKGACEPLRHYQKWYPMGQHRREVNKALAQIGKRVELRPAIRVDRDPFADEVDLGQSPFDERDECKKLVGKNEQHAKARCDGRVFAANLLGKRTRIISLELVEDKVSCSCKKGIFGGYYCTMNAEYACRLEEQKRYELENCSSIDH